MEEKREKKFKSRIPDEAREHVHAARKAMREGVESLMPEEMREFREHRKVARREMLLAFRSLIDAAIKRTEADAEEAED